MARKLKTKKGRAVYSRRKAIVEPIFGQIDTVQDGRRLLLRGKQAARAQWRFTCAVHNLLKLHRAGGLVLVDHAQAGKDADGSRNRPLAAPDRTLRHAARFAHRRLIAVRNTRMPMLAPLPVTDPGS